MLQTLAQVRYGRSRGGGVVNSNEHLTDMYTKVYYSVEVAEGDSFVLPFHSD